MGLSGPLRQGLFLDYDLDDFTLLGENELPRQVMPKVADEDHVSIFLASQSGPPPSHLPI